MAENAQQLAEYKLQLQQVEAALTVDPDNEDLKKLKTDLQEVLQLTQDLLVSQILNETPNDEEGDAISAAPENIAAPSHSWKAGDRCIAIWSEDNQSYTATIDETLDDGTCTITFDSYGNTDVTQISLLRPLEEASGSADGTEMQRSKPKTKKDQLAAQREYKRKKNQKKAQRLKALEEERETEKNKWMDFNSKTFSKTNKGKVKRSIFATPDAVNGRVGVGTCGIGGRPMTNYTHQEKWTKK